MFLLTGPRIYPRVLCIGWPPVVLPAVLTKDLGLKPAHVCDVVRLPARRTLTVKQVISLGFVAGIVLVVYYGVPHGYFATAG